MRNKGDKLMTQEVIKIRGGQTLKGDVTISGAKNSAVAIIPNIISSRPS